jgi:hypothetical protein
VMVRLDCSWYGAKSYTARCRVALPPVMYLETWNADNGYTR